MDNERGLLLAPPPLSLCMEGRWEEVVNGLPDPSLIYSMNGYWIPITQLTL